MKWIKFSLFYGCLIFFINHLYSTLTPYILFHYPFFDFRYLIFILIQIIWSLLFYQIVYQYICLDTFIKLRLSLYQRSLFFIKQWFIYLIFYTIIHLLFLSLLSIPIPYHFLGLQLSLWSIVFIFSLVFHHISSYHYVSMVSIMISIHLFL